MKLRYHGHSAFELRGDSGHTVLIDPWLDENPQATVKSDSINADYIVITHAHFDHLGDAEKIARRCKAEIICVVELCSYFENKGLKTHPLQIGGSKSFPFGRVKLTIAWHGSQTPDGAYAGLAAGVLLWMDGVCVYHTGDTGLFQDMKLIGELQKVDYMLAPIGDIYTMGIDDAVKAAELVRPGITIPMHYNTWPIIAADPEVFAAKIKALGLKCLILKPGDEV